MIDLMQFKPMMMMGVVVAIMLVMVMGSQNKRPLWKALATEGL